MSASKHITIWCDNPRCNGWNDHGEPTVTAAREWARLDGWLVGLADRTRQPGNNQRLDFCSVACRDEASR